MSARSSRLAGLARLRDLQEKQAASAVVAAAAVRADRDAAVARAVQSYAGAPPDQGSRQPAQVVQRHEVLCARAASVRSARADAAAAEHHEQERRAEHAQARRNAEGLRRLHEQAVARERADQASKDQLAVDDVTAARWVRAHRQDRPEVMS